MNTCPFLFAMSLHNFLISLLTGLALCAGAWAQDKPAPNYKPYPEKASKAQAEKVPEELAPSFSKPLKKEPQLALKARPPTSGKEPMLNLNEQNLPLKEIMHQTTKLDFYDCDGVVAPWFRQLMAAEMNYFAEMVEMPFVTGDFCVVSLGTSRSLTPGRISIHLYTSRQALQECVVRERCPAFRSVNLLPRTGNGVYRSYFLSDMDRKMIAQHCVTSKGKWHPDTTCYPVD
ncbi:MAG: hypothetical protein EBQ82_04560 [Betaproteobacteria bacterium]|nr:hypothetical protein [Betaproteobacteria bacterium]NBY04671.1 hypothetical protein [Betaproteobacteria bacterium]